MKKKVLSIVITLMLAVLLVPAACAPAEPAKEVIDLKISGGTVTGGTYISAIIMSQAINQSDRLRSYVSPSPGWIDCARLVAQGRVDISATGTGQIRNMMEGTAYFEGEKYTGIRWLWPYMASRSWIISKQGSPFQTLQDLRNATTGIPDPGTSGEVNATILFSALGFEPKRVVHLPYRDMASALKDGTIDTAWFQAGLGAPVVTEATTINDAHFIPLDDETWGKLDAMGLGYVRMVVPAGSYRLQDEELPLLATLGYIIATEELSEGIVYEVCKLNWEDIDWLVRINPTIMGETISVVEQVLNQSGPCPIHTGAYRYFEEVGMIE